MSKFNFEAQNTQTASKRKAFKDVAMPIAFIVDQIGVDRYARAQLPSHELAGLSRRGYSVLVSSTFVLFATYIGGLIAFNGRADAYLMVLPALVVAAAVANWDISFIAAGIIGDGERAAFEERLIEDLPKQSQWPMAFRALLSAVLAVSCVLMLKLAIFNPDISKLQKEEQDLNNSPLVERYTALATRREDQLAKSLEEKGKLIGALQDERETLSSSDNLIEQDLVDARKRQADAADRLAATESDLENAKRMYEVEFRGQTAVSAGGTTSTGQTGCGQACLFWKGEIQRLNKLREDRAKALMGARVESEGIRGAVLTQQADLSARQTVRSAEIDSQMSKLENSRDELRDQLDALRADRGSWVDAQVMSDEQYVPLAMNLSDRIGALEPVLGKTMLTKVFAIALTLLLVALDCAAVIGHITAKPLRVAGLRIWKAREQASIALAEEIHPHLIRQLQNQITRRKAFDELLTMEASASAFAEFAGRNGSRH